MALIIVLSFLRLCFSTWSPGPRWVSGPSWVREDIIYYGVHEIFVNTAWTMVSALAACVLCLILVLVVILYGDSLFRDTGKELTTLLRPLVEADSVSALQIC